MNNPVTQQKSGGFPNCICLEINNLRLFLKNFFLLEMGKSMKLFYGKKALVFSTTQPQAQLSLTLF